MKFKLQGSNDDIEYQDIIHVEDTGFSTSKTELTLYFKKSTFRYFKIMQDEVPESSSHPKYLDIGFKKLDFLYNPYELITCKHERINMINIMQLAVIIYI